MIIFSSATRHLLPTLKGKQHHRGPCLLSRFPPEEKKATRCGAFYSSSQNDGRKGKEKGTEWGATFAAPLCPRISLCNLCNRLGDDDTISLQNDSQLGTSAIDVHPTERGETLTDSNPALVNSQPFSSIRLPKDKPIRVVDT